MLSSKKKKTRKNPKINKCNPFDKAVTRGEKIAKDKCRALYTAVSR
jgi:hypothetical protein